MSSVRSAFGCLLRASFAVAICAWGSPASAQANGQDAMRGRYGDLRPLIRISQESGRLWGDLIRQRVAAQSADALATSCAFEVEEHLGIVSDRLDAYFPLLALGTVVTSPSDRKSADVVVRAETDLVIKTLSLERERVASASGTCASIPGQSAEAQRVLDFLERATEAVDAVSRRVPNYKSFE
jgi:hypothetical protein